MRVHTRALFLTLAPVCVVCAMLAWAGDSTLAPRIDPTPFLGDHYPVRRVSFRSGVNGFADVTYSTIPGFRPLTLDVYVPPAAARPKGLPLVLYIHGGGWANGHSRQSGAFDDWPGVLASLAARGYVVASLNYRLSSEAPFPAAVQDVKWAIRFLRAHATEYGVDPTKAIVWGGSAGGHLAALTATTCGVKSLEPSPPTPATPETTAVAAQSDCVQGAVTWYGIFDLASMTGATPGALPPPVARFLACSSESCSTDTLDAASPQHFVKSDMPPFLLVHGSADKTVNPSQSTRFLDAAVAAGAHATLIMIPDVDHSFIGATPGSTQEASLLALNKTFEFIDSTFKHP